MVLYPEYPWNIVTQKFSRQDHAIEGEVPVVRMGGCDAVVMSLGATKAECEQRASLICAAPDLLEFAKYVARPSAGLSDAEVQEEYEPNAATLILKARSVIAKAKGADQ